MKFLNLLVLLAAIASPNFLLADQPPAVEKMVTMLHDAQAAEKPLPLLEKVQEHLKDYDATPGGNGKAKGGKKAKVKHANNEEGKDRKKEAMEKLKAAIDLAKEGKDADKKIQATISAVIHMGDLKD